MQSATPENTNTFSIVIPAWNEADLIEATVQSSKAAIDIVASEGQYTGEIIVVNNNSSDDTASIAEQAGATVVFEPINQIARARNTGARASDATWLIFLDADTTLTPELLTTTLQLLSSGNVTGGGSTMTFDRKLKGLILAAVNFWNWWSVKTRAAAGSYLFCQRIAFDAVGGFDEKQYVAEELVLSKKLRKYAKQHKQQFIILDKYPVITSARKLQWYSRSQQLKQFLLLLTPGSTRSKKRLAVWYDRSNIDDDKK